MTPREFQIEFERRLQIADPTLIRENKLSSDQIFSILNEAIDLFWKTRYSGINPKALGFEQSLKRIDDLRTLTKTKLYTSTDIKGSDDNKEYIIELPLDYTLTLGDSVDIIPIDNNIKCWSKDGNNNYIPYSTDTLEATIETIDRMKLNSLSEYLLKYCKARPIKLINNNNIILYTDGKYKPNKYTLTYISKPSKLEVSNNTPYSSLPEHTHIEIVKLAVKSYLATRPLQSYNSYSNEVNNME